MARATGGAAPSYSERPRHRLTLRPPAANEDTSRRTQSRPASGPAIARARGRQSGAVAIDSADGSDGGAVDQVARLRTHAPSDGVAVRTATEKAAVAHIYSHLVTAGLSNVALVAFVALALWGDLSASHLLAWSGALIGASVGRLFLFRAYQQCAEPDPSLWSRRYLVALTASGVLWGVSVPLFALAVSPLQQMVLLLAIAGITGGGLPMNAAVLRNYIVFLYTAVLPVAATYTGYALFGGGTGEHLVLGTITLFYAASLTSAARTHARDQRHSYELSARLDAANRELRQRASVDALTGLWNRDWFELALDAELKRQARYGGIFSLIMFDIDRFKQINDTYGHDLGDQVLAELGQRVAGHLREPDQAARWGGEEFMVLLPETSLETAPTIAERLRRVVTATPFEGAGRVTLSLGVASYHGNEDRKHLLKRLDDALYAAKQGGRDRIDIADDRTT